MAELIPITYRLKTAQKHQVEKWLFGGVLVVALSFAGLAYTFIWEHKQASAQALLQAQYQAKAQSIAQSQALIAQRNVLADRMKKLEGLRNDKILLALLSNISDGFSPKDCLECISIDARVKTPQNPVDPSKPADADAPPPPPLPDHYIVRLTGVTENSATLADLVNRLSKQASPPMNVILQSSHRDNMLDGQVMRFEILCEKPGANAGARIDRRHHEVTKCTKGHEKTKATSP